MAQASASILFGEVFDLKPTGGLHSGSMIPVPNVSDLALFEVGSEESACQSLLVQASSLHFVHGAMPSDLPQRADNLLVRRNGQSIAYSLLRRSCSDSVCVEGAPRRGK